MRVALTAAAGAIVLVACADAKTSTGPYRGVQPSPPDTHAESALVGSHIDPRSLGDRIDALVAPTLAQVAIPPDGFSQSPDAVHPDIACPPGEWNGRRCWFFYTPYKNSDPSYENPGMLMASNDTVLDTPPEVVNPVVRYPGSGSYNSDPDHAFDPVTHRLVQVYRVVTDSFNKIMIMSTGDARRWTTPVLAFQAPNHDAISPSLIIAPDRSARVWYVRAGVAGCTASSSAVEMREASPEPGTRFEDAAWSPPTPVDLAAPGAVVWHLDVLALPNDRGYLALVVAFPRGSACGNSDLYLATSQDGVHWQTYPAPALWRDMPWARRRSVTSWYRGTLRYDAETDMLHMWPSALLDGRTWSVYHASAKLSELARLLGGAKASDIRALGLRRHIARTVIEMP
ncbi:MAG: hypothetical protein ACHQWU_04425 [Gemmatimonadales bacterium]